MDFNITKWDHSSKIIIKNGILNINIKIKQKNEAPVNPYPIDMHVNTQ